MDKLLKEVDGWKLVERDNGWFIVYRPNGIPEYQSKSQKKSKLCRDRELFLQVFV